MCPGVRERSFDSKLVRLKVSILAKMVRSIPFQFQTGAIKRLAVSTAADIPEFQFQTGAIKRVQRCIC